jgi:hypothetical protein
MITLSLLVLNQIHNTLPGVEAQMEARYLSKLYIKTSITSRKNCQFFDSRYNTLEARAVQYDLTREPQRGTAQSISDIRASIKYFHERHCYLQLAPKCMKKRADELDSREPLIYIFRNDGTRVGEISCSGDLVSRIVLYDEDGEIEVDWSLGHGLYC